MAIATVILCYACGFGLHLVQGAKLRAVKADQGTQYANLMEWMGYPANRLTVEVEPGESSYQEEKEYAEQLVGDGVGEPNYFLTDGPFLAEELQMLSANIFVPEIFPHHDGLYGRYSHPLSGARE